MELEFLEYLAMVFLRRLESWVMHKISDFIKSKIFHQEFISREKYLEKLRVLHKSSNFLVVNKHPDLVFNTNPPDDRLSLYEQISFKYPELIQPKLVHGFYVAHRLDYSTSGVVLVPLTKKATTEVTKQFENRKARKFYVALVWGDVETDNLDVQVDIGKDSHPDWENVRMVPGSDPYCVKPRQSRTKMKVLERGLYRNKPATKLLLSPVTGRRHQLRVHCHYIGHTIVGDYTYSNRRDVLTPRMFLHAHRLVVDTKLENIDVKAEDTFVNCNFSDWKPTRTVCDMSDAYVEMFDGELPWKCITEN